VLIGTAHTVTVNSLNESINQSINRLWVGIVDEAECSCSSDKETIEHLILSYLRWTAERRELRAAVGDRSGDIAYLLGG
jgi:hypothetical protein